MSGYRFRIELPSRRPYTNNLHHIVNTFMDSDCTHWLNIDADNPPRKNPLPLIELDHLDIIGLPTPIWKYNSTQPSGHRPVYWNAYDYVPETGAYTEHTTREGLQEVDAVGSGCMLVSRRVFENEQMRNRPFARKLNSDGTVARGTDISFCERAKACGFKIYCHFDYPCDHYHEMELNEVVAGFRNMYDGC